MAEAPRVPAIAQLSMHFLSPCRTQTSFPSPVLLWAAHGGRAGALVWQRVFERPRHRALRHRQGSALAHLSSPVQSQGQLKVSAEGFNWRKSGGGKDITVKKDGASCEPLTATHHIRPLPPPAVRPVCQGLMTAREAPSPLRFGEGGKNPTAVADTVNRAGGPHLDAHPGRIPAVAGEEGAPGGCSCGRVSTHIAVFSRVATR